MSALRGPGVFGPAYRALLENDAHAPGSIELALLERLVLVAPETEEELYGASPAPPGYEAGSRPELERIVARATAGLEDAEARVEAIARVGADLATRAPDEVLLGGREEDILARGSDWCTDVARVAAALAQVAGFPSRLVVLADTALAYCAHDIVEIHRAGRWGAVDALTAVVYRRPDGAPAETRELLAHPSWIRAQGRGEETPFTVPEQFRAAAVAPFDVGETDRFDVTVTRPNAYYRAILDEAARGWPGGLRWLHGEDVG